MGGGIECPDLSARYSRRNPGDICDNGIHLQFRCFPLVPGIHQDKGHAAAAHPAETDDRHYGLDTRHVMGLFVELLHNLHDAGLGCIIRQLDIDHQYPLVLGGKKTCGMD
jgi:hypothetical protein